jgi:hypothetical protein
MRRIAELTVQRLSSELACLKALDALRGEEVQALGARLDELKWMLVGVSAIYVRGSFNRQRLETELSGFFGMARTLKEDLDLAYRRLTVAA